MSVRVRFAPVLVAARGVLAEEPVTEAEAERAIGALPAAREAS